METKIPVGGKIRVMLVDNSTVFLSAATYFLEAYPELEVVATSYSEEEAIGQAQRLQPQVILLDPTLSSSAGYDFVARLCSQFPLIPVIVLSLLDIDSFRRPALAAGAAAFVSKVSARTELLAAIRTVVGANPSAPREVVAHQAARLPESHSFAKGGGSYG